jgi:hypothetical protein
MLRSINSAATCDRRLTAVSQIRALLGGTVTRYAGGIIFRWEPDAVTAEFRNGRKQIIEYKIDGERYVFTSRIAKRGVVNKIGRERLARDILLWNRSTDVVTFRFNKRGELEGYIEQRAATLSAEELRFYLACLAREADRLEFLLTGQDYH